MSSPLPANAKQHYRENGNGEPNWTAEDGPSGSFNRAASIAMLGSSPAPPNMRYSSSPKGSIGGMSAHTYGSTDLDHVMTNASGGLFRPLSTPTYNYEDNTISADLPEDQIARVVKRHLIDTSPATSVLSSSPKRSIYQPEDTDDDGGQVRSVHQLPGGAITHDIYKWTEGVEQEQLARRQRSQSVYIPRQEPSDPALARLKDPGGFRRHFVVDKAAREGRKPPNWMTRTFVDFLALYGHFGGEDLSDDEDENMDEDDFMEGGLRYRHRRRRSSEEGGGDSDEDEASPLIRRAQANAVQGTATPAKAVFLLLKSFVGTGVMFLPKAFYNGGLFFSTTLLTAIACISLYAFLLLVETRNKVPVSFGDIGGILFGRFMRMAVLIAITFSQIGFVCAYMVFVAQNVQALIESIFQCELRIPLAYLIVAQIAIFVPLAMIRKIQKLSSFALIADLFILIGLVYLYYFDIFTLSTHGVADVEWVINSKSFPMFIGTAVFTYEGVGLVIPITESMAEPKKFPKVLSGTMVFITVIFLSVGFVSYLAFGSKVQTVILLNMPDTPMVNTVQALYAMAICLSIPLQLFPAIRIAENALFTRSGKHNPIVKWQKNGFRFAAVLVCSLIAIAGSGDLDKFVSLVGSLCCVPLCFLFPPLFHLKAIARTWKQKAIDIAILLFGILSMTYTTGITIALWSQGGEAAPISRCTPNGH
ncbi:transmembrane amino acid transporter protein-domain-containing protein [Radiomyces spectabilis]|uniref:transmembrane amino acid transporter protein-domain-containing protein n=1 Tax=Radiomyces spectabilis TaxID=64574 RepID=UPI002220E60C|nr:transmembrane amino acid transporter protein-domain-containing protein [Radiomyces spectabilis]KAI8377404.1 transmembrane amino acid transporter protein-domain-containing protein [Radiomyces spectabilis]